MDTNTSAKSSRIVLPDVSLAAIVRDEIMNPAGGIVDFVESTVPFVERAVIVDTGSKDGTREALEEMQAKYPHLVVLDRPFDDYASSRNFSLSRVKTKYALVLDADERIRGEDLGRLAGIIKDNPREAYTFQFYNRGLVEEDDGLMYGHNPRLFVSEGKYFKNFDPNMNEFLQYVKSGKSVLFSCIPFYTKITINHFIVDEYSDNLKCNQWYEKIVQKGHALTIAPSDVPESKEWKAYNPRREEFR